MPFPDMASITIRNLDEEVKRRLRIRAAEHGRSMEEEVREILDRVLGIRSAAERPGTPPYQESGASLWDEIRGIVEPVGGIDLPIPPRGPMREPPDFTK